MTVSLIPIGDRIIYAKLTKNQDSIAELFNDVNPLVRESVVTNPNTPQELLTKATSDEDPYVRMAVAASERATEEAMLILCFDENKFVRKSLAVNQAATKRVIKILQEDGDSGVSILAAAHKNAQFDNVFPMHTGNKNREIEIEYEEPSGYRPISPTHQLTPHDKLIEAKRMYEAGTPVKRIAGVTKYSESAIYDNARRGKWRRKRTA